MKILHTVEFYSPSIGGAQEVVRHLSERMVVAGHDVTVATTKLPDRQSLIHNGVKIVEFAISGNRVNGIKGEKEKYKEFLIKGGFDVVMNYAAQEWTADLFFEVIDKIKAKKIFVPCGYSALYDPTYKDYFDKLPEVLKKYDATVYLSDSYRDIAFAREHKLKNIHVIPNGADESEFTRPLDLEERKLLHARYGVGGLVLITIGNYTGEKGHMELLEAFKRLPVAKSTLVSVGTLYAHDGCFDEFVNEASRVNNGRKFIGKRVVMVDGKNRQDAVALLKSADIFVFLSNIECSPLVIFESAAAGLPFLATASGNNTELARWLESGIIVKSHEKPNGRVKADARDTLVKLTRLSHSVKLRNRLGEAGHENWLKKYTWRTLTDQYLNLYEDLLKEGARK